MTHISTALGGSVEAVRSELTASLGPHQPSLILTFVSPSQPLGGVVDALAAAYPTAKVLGASSAGEFNQHGDAKQSISAFALCGDLEVSVGFGAKLSEDAEGAVRAALDHGSSSREYPHETAIMLLDPLTGKGEEATLLAAALLGPDVPMAGGAAGDDLAMKHCEVAVPGQVASDAVVFARLRTKTRLGLGVAHGHTPLAGPFTATRAQDNVIFELDGRPAFEVWLEATRSDATQRGVDLASLPDGELGAYLLQYEVGLATGDSYKVRAPLSRGSDGSLSFACGVPEGASLHIMKGQPPEQVASARQAACSARAQVDGPIAGALVFDCICRNLILGEAFAGAVRAISSELGGVPIAGFETYGEIALEAGDMSGFHNTTSVVLAFPR